MGIKYVIMCDYLNEENEWTTSAYEVVSSPERASTLCECYNKTAKENTRNPVFYYQMVPYTEF